MLYTHAHTMQKYRKRTSTQLFKGGLSGPLKSQGGEFPVPASAQVAAEDLLLYVLLRIKYYYQKKKKQVAEDGWRQNTAGDSQPGPTMLSVTWSRRGRVTPTGWGQLDGLLLLVAWPRSWLLHARLLPGMWDQWSPGVWAHVGGREPASHCPLRRPGRRWLWPSGWASSSLCGGAAAWRATCEAPVRRPGAAAHAC